MARQKTEIPHPADVHVGLRIRARRAELRVSQSVLAEALGVSFQQVQKYERGANRVSASMLWEVSQVLQVPVGYFYEGLDASGVTEIAAAPLSPSRLFQNADGYELAQAYLQIPDGPARKIVLNLARQLAALSLPK